VLGFGLQSLMSRTCAYEVASQPHLSATADYSVIQTIAGAAAPSTAVANSAGGLAVLLAALFGGFLMSRAQMPALTRWLSSLSFVRCGRTC
jgi:predicted phage tail protein